MTSATRPTDIRTPRRTARNALIALLAGSMAAGPMMGCESLPGDEKSQGTVIGAAGGALAGAAVAGDNSRLVGALIGGALGAGGGYLIGTQVEKKNDQKNRDQAVKASQEAQKHPATAADVKNSRTADLNNDGFVTMDEVVAMEKAGLGDQEMIDRLERTQQYFVLKDQQEQYLRDQGVSDRVITAMRKMNPQVDEQAVISSDRSPNQSSSSHD